MTTPEPNVPFWKPPHGSPLDPRTHAFRTDLADDALIGRTRTQGLVAPMIVRCVVARCTLYISPDDRSEAGSELVFGETFNAVEQKEGWLWGWCGHDHYVGYCRADGFAHDASTPTHRTIARITPLFAGPGIKYPVDGRLPLGARLSIAQAEGAFLKVTTGGFVHHRHVTPIGSYATDPVAVAELLLGSPYLWGGRTGEGIDCSGLVQVALALCGVAAPRDSDQQMAALGQTVDPSDLRRGDLVFFPGHVGIMTDATNLIHANAYWMTTLVEPLADVVARLAPSHGEPVLAVKRLD